MKLTVWSLVQSLLGSFLFSSGRLMIIMRNPYRDLSVWPYLTVSAYDNSAVLPDDQMWAIVKFIEDVEEREGPLMFRDIMACVWLLLRMPAQRAWQGLTLVHFSAQSQRFL